VATSRETLYDLRPAIGVVMRPWPEMLTGIEGELTGLNDRRRNLVTGNTWTARTTAMSRSRLGILNSAGRYRDSAPSLGSAALPHAVAPMLLARTRNLSVWSRTPWALSGHGETSAILGRA
jgi:hypothetical protein